jgi:hypothetical protein
MLVAFRLFRSHLAAVLSGLLLLGSWDFLVESRNNQGTQDAMLLFLITASMALGWILLRQALAREKAVVRSSVVGLAVPLGLAISTKSLAGGLPMLLLLVALLANVRTQFVPFLVTNWKALLLAAFIVVAIPGLYYVPLFLRESDAWGHVFHGEIYNRLLGEGYHNQGRWDLYLDGIFVRRSTFPVALTLLGCAVALVHMLRGRDRMAWGFLLLWIILPLALYSSFSSRVFHYIAPVFPPLAILCGQGLAWVTAIALGFIRKSTVPRAAMLCVCSALALLPCYYLIGTNLRYTINSVSTSGKKIDIEKIASSIQEARARGPIRVVLFDMHSFLSGTGNQLWRFKFYLHLIRDNLRHESQIEQLRHETHLPGSLWVLAPIEHRDKLVEVSSACEVLPFVHPEGKRSHYRSKELRQGLGKPQFILVRYQC